MRIVLASLDPAWEDKAANLVRCRELAGVARDRGADLVAFPEMTLTGFSMNAAAIAEPADRSPTVEAFGTLARELQVNLAFGVVLHGRARPTNTLVVVDRTGEVVGRYVKVHPFTRVGEHEHFEAGDRPVIASVDGLPVGLTVCYDLRFPELYTALAPRCAVILTSACWPERRIAHWHALLLARAIECQCYVVGVNRTGTDANGLDHPRSSKVVDPRGVTAEPEWTEGVLDAFRVDPSAVDASRTRFPTLRDRRPDLYRRWLDER